VCFASSTTPTSSRATRVSQLMWGAARRGLPSSARLLHRWRISETRREAHPPLERGSENRGTRFSGVGVRLSRRGPSPALHQSRQNLLDNFLFVSKHVSVPKAHHAIALLLQPPRAPLVVQSQSIEAVLFAVKLHDQSCGRTIEVYDIGSDRVLPAKAHAEALSVQQLPKFSFCIRRTTAHLARMKDLGICTTSTIRLNVRLLVPRGRDADGNLSCAFVVSVCRECICLSPHVA
jgi:hypothetical protein